MLVFIDESGCAGFKVDKGSSPYFVVAMVVFDCDEDAQIVDREIDQIRTSSGHKPEFKFSKCRFRNQRELNCNRYRGISKQL